MSETSTRAVRFEEVCRAPLRVASLCGRGRGIVADQPIRQGDIVERAPVLIIPESDRAAVDASSLGNHIFMWEHGTTGEDIYSQKGRAALVLGFASLVNHSDDPNCRFIRHIEALALDLIALRDVEAGEELTFDYDMTLWFTQE